MFASVSARGVVPRVVPRPAATAAAAVPVPRIVSAVPRGFVPAVLVPSSVRPAAVAVSVPGVLPRLPSVVVLVEPAAAAVPATAASVVQAAAVEPAAVAVAVSSAVASAVSSAVVPAVVPLAFLRPGRRVRVDLLLGALVHAVRRVAADDAPVFGYVRFGHPLRALLALVSHLAADEAEHLAHVFGWFFRALTAFVTGLATSAALRIGVQFLLRTRDCSVRRGAAHETPVFVAGFHRARALEALVFRHGSAHEAPLFPWRPGVVALRVFSLLRAVSAHVALLSADGTGQPSAVAFPGRALRAVGVDLLVRAFEHDVPGVAAKQTRVFRNVFLARVALRVPMAFVAADVAEKARHALGALVAFVVR